MRRSGLLNIVSKARDNAIDTSNVADPLPPFLLLRWANRHCAALHRCLVGGVHVGEGEADLEQLSLFRSARLLNRIGLLVSLL